MAGLQAVGTRAAALTAGAIALAMLAPSGCARGARTVPETDPAGTPQASALPSEREVSASLSDRAAWAASIAGRGDLGPRLLADLGRRGFFSAQLCPAQEGAWTLDPGRPLAAYRVTWSCPACADPVRGGRDSGPAVPEDAVRPWPAGGSPAGDVDRDVGRLLGDWGEAGHPLGRVRASTRREDSLLVVELDAHPGPAVRVDALRFDGNRVTRPGFLLRLLAWRGSEAWRTGRWESARAALFATGLFDEVEGPLLQRAPGGDPRADSLAADVIYRFTERRVNSFTGLVGYTGKTGRVSGFVNLELGNLLGTGRRGRVLWQAQRERESRFELGWHEPFVWRLPLAADLKLEHMLEDTLYAETRWGLDLVLAAGGGWEVRGGWSWGRLVVGSESGVDRQRQTARFGIRRSEPLGTRAARGWELGVDLANTRDTGEMVRQGLGRVRGWIRERRLMLLVEEQAGLVAGVDDVLRGDALSVGGAGSLRGFFETAFRATRFVVQRAEVGPAPSRAGTRFYALVDLGW